MLPIVGRLSAKEWLPLIFYFCLAWLEFIVLVVTKSLPSTLIDEFTKVIRFIYSFMRNPYELASSYKETSERESMAHEFIKTHGQKEIAEDKYNLMKCILNSSNIGEMCELFGYAIESRVLKTEDDYILTLHRITRPGNEVKKNGKVVYLHHGLLMSSEVWITMLEKEQNLPFVLYDLGYDVWLGNNRGNKYSRKHLKWEVTSDKFWNFSLDEYSLFDIPNTIDYILDITEKKTLIYVGFSQGTAQAFASASIKKSLNQKLEKIIAISPATTPHGLTSSFFDIFSKSSPTIMYLIFARKALLPSVFFWQRIIYPPFFNTIIDYSNYLLFNWKSENITNIQKLASYAHLYLSTSVKTVVHWFQVMAAKNFQMYDTSDLMNQLSPVSYPFKTIQVPIYLIYGTQDSLVDINVMEKQLPEGLTKAYAIENHEHLDNLWGSDCADTVIKYVVKFVQEDSSVEI